MFYYQQSFRQGKTENPVSALFSLVPAESKRLIAKCIAAIPEVKLALEQGTIIVGRGTTNSFVAEELTGQIIEPKCHYAAGIIVDGELSAVPAGTRLKPIVLNQGKPTNIAPIEALNNFRKRDVFIKGANAIDSEGNAGVLAASDVGGTIGEVLPIVLPRGCYLFVPVGLEKLIPSVVEAARASGIFRFKYSTGLPTGFVHIPNALVVTEVQAFQILTGVKAVPIAAGGNAGSEGTIVLSLEGTNAQIEEALSLMKSIKGEPSISKPADRVNPAAADLDYDAIEQWYTLSQDFREKYSKH